MVGRDRRQAVQGGVVWAFLGAVVLLAAETSGAQPPDAGRRREFVQGLLQTLIDSQLPPPPASRPAKPAPPVPPARLSPPAELAEVVTRLESFATDSRELLGALQTDWSRSEQLGPLIGDTAKVHHAASALAGKYRPSRLYDLAPIADEYSSLNREWRILANRIQQTRNLSQKCYGCVGLLNQHDRRLCTLLNVEPQLDGNALLRQMAALAVDLRNLGEDLESDLPPSEERTRLLPMCRKAQQEAGETTEAVYGSAAGDVVRQSYQAFRSDWSRLAAALRPIDNPYVQRTVRRIWETDRAVHELLWIPYQTDPAHLLYMAQVLRGHIDALYDTVSLEDLIDLPPARQVLPTASEFYGLCEYFILCAENKESLDALAQAYWDLDAAWPEFSACFAPAKSPEVQRTLAEIEQSMNALRQLLGIPPAIDWELARQRSSRLEYLAHALERSLASSMQASSQYPSHVRARLSSAADRSRSFCVSCGALNSRIVAKTSPKKIGPECTVLAQAWTLVHKDMLSVFREEDVLRSTSEIARTLVELQTTFGP